MFTGLFRPVRSAEPAAHAPELIGLHVAYAAPFSNVLYNLFFCDDLELYRQKRGATSAAWHPVLAETFDLMALSAIAGDETNEGRVRALAYNRLRQAGRVVPVGRVLGVVIETPRDMGLDVVAAYSGAEGDACYLYQQGSSMVCQGKDNTVCVPARELLAVSSAAIVQCGTSGEPRRAPPVAGHVRVTIVASDGLHIVEGPFQSMAQGPVTGPVLTRADRLRQSLSDLIRP